MSGSCKDLQFHFPAGHKCLKTVKSLPSDAEIRWKLLPQIMTPQTSKPLVPLLLFDVFHRNQDNLSLSIMVVLENLDSFDACCGRSDVLGRCSGTPSWWTICTSATWSSSDWNQRWIQQQWRGKTPKRPASLLCLNPGPPKSWAKVLLECQGRNKGPSVRLHDSCVPSKKRLLLL